MKKRRGEIKTGKGRATRSKRQWSYCKKVSLKKREGEDVSGKKRKKTKTEVFKKMREWIERLRMEEGLWESAMIE